MTVRATEGSLPVMRRIRDEVEARACLAKVTESGRPLAAWSREHGIDGRSLNTWRVNLERRELAALKPRFVELVPRASMSARYAVVVGDVRIEVDDSFQPETLARLVAALRSC
jgi:hypothetical protein